MAVIVRRTWAQLRDEVIRRAQGIDASTFSGRVEYALWAAYQDLCLSYHHFELDKLDTSLSLSTSTNSLALPTDCYIVVSVRLRSVAGTVFANQLAYQPARILMTEYRAEVAKPTQYTRFLNTLYFNKLPDLAYHVDLFYYKSPLAPDFSSTSPETHPEMDEHLIQAALGILLPSLGRPDLAQAQLSNLRDWLSLNVRPAMVAETPAGKRERFEANVSHGGQQG